MLQSQIPWTNVMLKRYHLKDNANRKHKGKCRSIGFNDHRRKPTSPAWTGAQSVPSCLVAGRLTGSPPSFTPKPTSLSPVAPPHCLPFPMSGGACRAHASENAYLAGPYPGPWRTDQMLRWEAPVPNVAFWTEKTLASNASAKLGKRVPRRALPPCPRRMDRVLAGRLCLTSLSERRRNELQMQPWGSAWTTCLAAVPMPLRIDEVFRRGAPVTPMPNVVF